MTSFLQTLRWKREYKSDSEKFEQPYNYTFQSGAPTLVLQQQRFRQEGFASTVWDSSIVLSKLLERHGEVVRGQRCLDLSAGCGLVAAVMSHLDPVYVAATDLPANLPLLQRNCSSNGGGMQIHVEPYKWGEGVHGALGGGFDLVVACDVMYSTKDSTALVRSLEMLMKPDSIALVCHGRNAHAEETFLGLCKERFRLSLIEWEAFDSVFRSEEISCWQLQKLRSEERNLFKGPVSENARIRNK